MSTVLAFVAGYFALMMALSLVVRPTRRRLAVLADELRRQSLKPDMDRAVQSTLATAYSIRAAPLMLLSTVIAILTPSARFDRQARIWATENPEIAGDRRWGELFDAYYASIAAVNPIFGALLYAARIAFRLKAYLFVIRRYRPRHEQLADLQVKPKIALRPKVTELEIFGEMKAAEAA